jgi:hypothetical protein
VLELVDKIKADGGVVPGIITIGVFEKNFYKLDGQHRLEAFLLTKLPVGYCDVRFYYATSEADMGEEFVRQNSSLVHMRPDDYLRGLEGTYEPLEYIRRHCPFVGYDQVRRGPKSPVVGMSVLLRCWFCSEKETPSSGGMGGAVSIAKSLTPESAKHCAAFITLAEKAWGRDQEYARLYSALNLTLCMWLFRRIVLEPKGGVTPLTPIEFQSCLTALSADVRYLDYIVGRKLSDRDRSPAYGRVKQIFQNRYKLEAKKRAKFPSPSWAANMAGS